MPELVDSIYASNALFYRLDRANKRVIRGGTQIEQPIIYKRFGSSGSYKGFDLLDTTPQDVIKNAAWDWKQKYVTVSVDGLTLIKNDSPESVADLVKAYFEIAREEMEELLGAGLFTDSVTDANEIDGLQGAVDNGTVAATYAGLGSRTTTNSFWQPATGALDTTTAVLTIPAMQAVFGAATDGARHPTLILTTQANYNRFSNLVQPQQRFPSEPAGQDEQLAKAGFTNLLFNNVPVVVDSHCNANHIYFLNEDYILIAVSPRADMKLEDFQTPVNQDAAVAKILWAGNLILQNVRRQGLMNAVAA